MNYKGVIIEESLDIIAGEISHALDKEHSWCVESVNLLPDWGQLIKGVFHLPKSKK